MIEPQAGWSGGRGRDDEDTEVRQGGVGLLDPVDDEGRDIDALDPYLPDPAAPAAHHRQPGATTPDLEYAQILSHINYLINGILPGDSLLNENFDTRDRMCSTI